MNSALKSFDTTENVPLSDEDVGIVEVTADFEETDLFLPVERNPPVQFGLDHEFRQSEFRSCVQRSFAFNIWGNSSEVDIWSHRTGT